MLSRDSRSRIAGFLDIGTAKTCCLIAEQPALPGGPWRVLGLGHQRSRGIKAGVIVNMDEAEITVRAAVDQAERAAGQQLEDVVVAVESGRLRSLHVSAHADLGRGVVTSADLERLGAGARAYAERDGRILVHLNSIGYRIDGEPGFQDPVGMAGRRLTGELHAVSADEGALRNLSLLIGRCHLTLGGLVPTGLASGLACAGDEERQLGVTVIDIGAGATSIAVFRDGRFVHTDVIPVGGQHISFDIARILMTPLAEAERIKTLYGTMVAARSDEREVLTYPSANDREGALHQTTKAELRGIVAPRVAMMAGLLRERLDRSPPLAAKAGRVILTGGAAGLVGLGGYLADALGRPVRVGRPDPLPGLPPGMCNPALATVIGLIAVTGRPEALSRSGRDVQIVAPTYLGRMEQWLRESF